MILGFSSMNFNELALYSYFYRTCRRAGIFYGGCTVIKYTIFSFGYATSCSGYKCINSITRLSGE